MSLYRDLLDEDAGMEEFADPNCSTTARFHAAVRARLERPSS